MELREIIEEKPMTGLTLYYHPFAAYCQKVLIALYEGGTDFTPLLVDLGDPEHRAVLEAAWPIMRFPVLKDEAHGLMLPESSTIIEHLQTRVNGFAAIPADPALAIEARLMDRVFDNYVMTPMQKVVFDRMRPDGSHDPHGVAEARAMLDTAYALIDKRIAGRTWAAGEAFTIADCAAAPALFYADWIQPFDAHANLAGYFKRLMARPSFARIVEEARPHRDFFPRMESDRISA